MNAQVISSDFAVAPQIAPRDVAYYAKKGFRAIICNRPDGEAADQPLADDIRYAATSRGLRFAYMPVAPTGVEARHVETFRKTLAALPKPVLAYCRTGGRSAALWAFSSADKAELEDMLAACADAGCDLGAIRRRLDRMAKESSAL